MNYAMDDLLDSLSNFYGEISDYVDKIPTNNIDMSNIQSEDSAYAAKNACDKNISSHNWLRNKVLGTCSDMTDFCSTYVLYKKAAAEWRVKALYIDNIKSSIGAISDLINEVKEKYNACRDKIGELQKYILEKQTSSLNKNLQLAGLVQGTTFDNYQSIIETIDQSNERFLKEVRSFAEAKAVNSYQIEKVSFYIQQLIFKKNTLKDYKTNLYYQKQLLRERLDKLFAEISSAKEKMYQYSNELCQIYHSMSKNGKSILLNTLGVEDYYGLIGWLKSMRV